MMKKITKKFEIGDVIFDTYVNLYGVITYIDIDDKKEYYSILLETGDHCYLGEESTILLKTDRTVPLVQWLHSIRTGV